MASDIRLLYSLNIIDDFKSFAQYFDNPQYEISWLNHRTWRFPPEQYLGVELAKKIFSDLVFVDCLSYQNVDMNKSKKFILNNFITLDYRQSNILLSKGIYTKMCKKFYRIPPHVFFTMYSYDRYSAMYYEDVLWRRIMYNIVTLYKNMYYYIKNWKVL